jgi:hypothetical protein
MLLFKALIKQQMKARHLSYRQLALKTGINFKDIRDLIENMQNHPGVMNLEKIMMMLGLFTFDDKEVDAAMKKEFKKLEKTKKDYLY